MNNASVVYHRELLIPSNTVSLYFKVAKRVQVKDFVAAIRAFTLNGSVALDLEPLSYSRKLSRPYIYLRSPRGSVGDWVTKTVSASQPIKQIEIEILHWSASRDYKIEENILGVWVGASVNTPALDNPVNFVAIRGAK